ncbi:unnamed protein product [Phytophthora lilii]|uniref:Unnamed protein product n=1 Tax=Phytophthora lilii TaxID=2077276 RepID=A0A9W6YIW8_9STRA|nr:unnamed protein product [Phytophthora lilii]
MEGKGVRFDANAVLLLPLQGIVHVLGQCAELLLDVLGAVPAHLDGAQPRDDDRHGGHDVYDGRSALLCAAFFRDLPHLGETAGSSCCWLKTTTNSAELLFDQVYILSALGLFFYQTMDALDGKQARRTGASSPLGQLFDHGCDAVCTVFNVLSAAATCQVGVGLRPYIALSSVSIAFYLAQWEEYHTGVMSCGNGFYGVTEGQLTLVAVHLAAAFFGAGFWTAGLPFETPFPVSMTDVLIGALVASNVLLAYGNISNVLRAAPDAIPRDELGNKQISKPLALFQLIPIGILLALGSLWICGPDAENYENYPVVFLFPIGIGYVFFSVRIVPLCSCF